MDQILQLGSRFYSFYNHAQLLHAAWTQTFPQMIRIQSTFLCEQLQDLVTQPDVEFNTKINHTTNQVKLYF